MYKRDIPSKMCMAEVVHDQDWEPLNLYQAIKKIRKQQYAVSMVH